MKLEMSHREIAPGIVVITLAGRLILGPEGAQFESLAKGLYDQGTPNVIVDLAAVSHIDSTGIGRCIAILNKALQGKNRLHMAGAKGQVRDSFHVTRLDRMFKFFDTLEAAQNALPK
jgi:anti-sigma B factor antagonist